MSFCHSLLLVNLFLVSSLPSCRLFLLSYTVHLHYIPFSFPLSFFSPFPFLNPFVSLLFCIHMSDASHTGLLSTVFLLLD